jgi:hypothetical protein
MCRWLPTTALLGALVLFAGCGPTAATGTGGGPQTSSPGSTTGKSTEKGKDTPRKSTDFHDPG